MNKHVRFRILRRGGQCPRNRPRRSRKRRFYSTLAKAYLSEFYVLLEDAKNFARFSKNLSRSGTRVKIKYSNTTFMDQLVKTRESACNDIFNYCKRFIYRCKKKLRLYGIHLNLVKSNLLTFHYNAHSSHLFNSQIHFPTLVRGKFLSSPRSNSLFNAFTPVFFTTHIPWWIASLGESFGKC